MRKATICGFGLALLFFATGCGDSPEKFMKDQISLGNEMLDILDKVDSKEDMDKAKTKLEALEKKGKALQERAEKLKLKELSDDKKKALTEKYKKDMEKLQERQVEVMTKLAKKGVVPDLGGLNLGGGFGPPSSSQREPGPSKPKK
jgi:hypothetical protein